MPNPLISQITLQNGTTYDLKDAQAREDIAELQQSLVNGVSYLGETTTVISDGSTTNTILIDGKTVTAEPGDIVTYQESEFIFGKVSLTWREFGSTGALKALAFKSSASGKVTPTGTISAPTFTGTATVLRATVATSGNVTISTGSGTANYTPAGTVSQPTFTGTGVDLEAQYNGSSADISINYTPEGTVSAPVFTGDELTVTVS